MNKKDREELELRQKILGLQDILSKISQFSWRIKKAKDLYPLGDSLNMYFLFSQFNRILGDFIKFAEEELPEMKEIHKSYLGMLKEFEKEVENEN